MTSFRGPQNTNRIRYTPPTSRPAENIFSPNKNTELAAGIPDLPTSGFQDVDEAVFTLFKDDIGLFYKSKGIQKRVEVLFAAGERFAVLNKHEPIRVPDSGALILPLVSIMPSGVEFGTNTLARYPGGTMPVEHTVEEIGGHKRKRTTYIDNPIPFVSRYKVTIWSEKITLSNRLAETIMSSAHVNGVGEKAFTYKLRNKNGLWYYGFLGNSVTFDGTVYNELTGVERYVYKEFDFEVWGYLFNTKSNPAQMNVSVVEQPHHIVAPVVPTNNIPQPLQIGPQQTTDESAGHALSSIHEPPVGTGGNPLATNARAYEVINGRTYLVIDPDGTGREKILKPVKNPPIQKGTVSSG